MVPFYDRAFHLLDNLGALVRVRVVTDHIAEANVMGAVSRARVCQNGLSRLEIGVEVAENGKAHVGRKLK